MRLWLGRQGLIPDRLKSEPVEQIVAVLQPKPGKLGIELAAGSLANRAIGGIDAPHRARGRHRPGAAGVGEQGEMEGVGGVWAGAARQASRPDRQEGVAQGTLGRYVVSQVARERNRREQFGEPYSSTVG